MKFINYLEKIAGINMIGIVSFFIFFILFVVMAVWAYSADKKLIETMANIPFEGEKN